MTPWRTGLALFLALAVCASIPTQSEDVGGDGPFRRALPGYVFRFPADHASHPAFRTEWWYYTGHLWIGEAMPAGDGARPPDLGFQLTFFRSGIARPDSPRASAWAVRDLYFAHFTVSDLRRGGRFHFAERAGRDALGMAGADSTTYRVWIDDWGAKLMPDSIHHRLTAPQAEPSGHGLELTLVPVKPPAIHGAGGVSKKGALPGEASHYYSLTALTGEGEVRLGEERLKVHGTAWMDHEFSTGPLPAGLVGWDWFGLALDGNGELMIYLLRRADGSPAEASAGSWVTPGGEVIGLTREDIQVTSDRRWKSPRSGAEYPARWRIAVRAKPGVPALDLQCEPRLADQELVTTGSTGITYWEGAVLVRGERDGAPVAGRGYVELTGYAAPLRARM
jgi:predicted secreted hydrolase